MISEKNLKWLGEQFKGLPLDFHYGTIETQRGSSLWADWRLVNNVSDRRHFSKEAKTKKDCSDFVIAVLQKIIRENLELVATSVNGVKNQLIDMVGKNKNLFLE